MGLLKVGTDIQTPPAFTNTAEVKTVPSSLARGGHGLLETEIIVTETFTDLTVSAFNPLGYDDTFHLGEPVKVLGGSFSCTEEAKWELTTGPSISRKSVGKLELTYQNLINLDQTHDETAEGNKINIKIPISALTDARPGQYAFTIGVQIGTESLVSTTQDITITDQLAATASTSPGQTAGTVQPLTPQVYPGGSAAFLISITVPGDLSWEVKVSGSISHTALGVLIHQTGLCAGFTSRFQPSSGGSFDADFGIVTNVDSGATTVELVVFFKVAEGATEGAISESVTIDGVQYSLTGSEVVASPTTVGDISGTGETLGPASLYKKFGVGVRTVLNIPATLLAKPLTFMTFPDDTVTDVQVKICRVEVEAVGQGLPCLYPQHDPAVQAAVYSKRSEDNLYKDVGKLELGASCPAIIASGQFSKQIAVSFIYELPQQTLSTGPYVMTGGLYAEDLSLWAASYSLSTNNNQLNGLEIWASLPAGASTSYLTARTDSATVKVNEPFPVRFVLKINKNTQGRIQFTVYSGPKAAICGIRILQIGRNLACLEKPEGSVDEHFRTTVGYYRRHQVNGEGWLVFDGLTNYGSSELETNMYADDNSIEVSVFFTARGNATITSHMNGASTETTIAASGEKAASTGPLAFEWVKVPLTDDDKIYSKIPKTLGILIDVPVGYSSPVRIKFADKDFSLVNFCSIKVTKVGRNLPCINQQQRATFPSKTETSLVKLDDYGNPSAYKEIYLDLTVCYFHNSDSAEENQFQVEVTFRLAAGAAEGDTVTIEAVTNVGGGGDERSKETSVTVSLDVPSFVIISNTSYAEVIENTTTPIYAG